MTPSASGKLADTPLAHLLVYARNRRLSGKLTLTAKAGESATLTLWRGRIQIVATTPPGLVAGGYFGAIAYELGFIDTDTLDATLLEIAKTKRLHGEVLVEKKKLTPEQRDQTLTEQIHRKVHYLFTLDDDATTYAFYDIPVAEPPLSADLVGPVWRGIRDFPPIKFVAETVRRVGLNQVRVVAVGIEEAKHAKARLPPLEMAIVELLRGHPMTVAEMKAATELPPARVDLLVYLLVIAKYIEAVSGERTHPSTGALPAAVPSGPIPRRSGHISSTQVPAFKPPPTIAMPTPSKAFVPMGAPPSVRTPAELGLDGVTAKAAAIDKEDYFTVLGLADGASAEAVRASYMRLVKTWHPDKLVVDFFPVRTDVAKVFSVLTLAQKTLTDPEARRAYIASRRPKEEERTRSVIMKEVEAALAAKGFEVVVKLTNELISKDADDAEAIGLQAWADVRGGDASEDEVKTALVKAERAVNVDRQNAPAVYYRGLLQKKLNNVFGAFRDFARAVQLDPTFTDAEREVRLFAMRAKKGSGEHKLAVDVLAKVDKK